MQDLRNRPLAITMGDPAGIGPEIIAEAVRAGASDIHLEPEREKFNCRYRYQPGRAKKPDFKSLDSD